MVRENAFGCFVPPFDPIAFAGALLRAMGARSLSLAEGRFDRRLLAGCFTNVLEASVAR